MTAEQPPTVEANISLVLWTMGRMNIASGQLDWDDLYQEGIIGLMDAVRKFNPERGAWSTYAVLRIKGAIIDALRRWHHPRRGAPQPRVMFVSYQRELESDAEIEPPDPVDQFAELETRMAADAIKVVARAVLSEREYDVMISRTRSELMREIAERYEISESRASQINVNAIRKVRKAAPCP